MMPPRAVAAEERLPSSTEPFPAFHPAFTGLYRRTNLAPLACWKMRNRSAEVVRMPRTLKDVVEPGVVLCRRDTPIHSVASQMLSYGVKAAVVVDDTLVPCGAISLRRIGRRHALRQTTVVARQVMEPVASLPASTSLAQAGDIARYLRVPYFVVTVRGALQMSAARRMQVVPAGLLARSDLIKLAG